MQKAPSTWQALVLNISAYLLWAGATVLFKALAHVPVWQLFAYRVLGALLVCSLMLWLSGHWRAARRLLAEPLLLGGLLLSGLLIASNWLMVIWAVANERLLEASLGYYLAPLCSLLLARGVFGEPFAAREGWALAVCGLGVAVLLASSGVQQWPWPGLLIALTFAAYSALKKRSSVPPWLALTLETLWVALPVAVWLIAEASQARLQPLQALDVVGLASLAVLTTAPLWLYLASLPALSLLSVSFLQYLNPTLMFVLAVWLFAEPLAPLKLLGFVLIWAGVLLWLLWPWWQRLLVSPAVGEARQ